MSPVSKALGLVTHGLTRHTFQHELLTKNQKFLASIPVIKAPYTQATTHQKNLNCFQYPELDEVTSGSTIQTPHSSIEKQARSSNGSSKFELHLPFKLNEQQEAIFHKFKAMTKNYDRAETLAKLGELDKSGFFKTSDDESEQALCIKHLSKYGGRYFTPAQMAIGEELGYALFKEMATNIEKHKMEAEKMKVAERVKEAEKIKASFSQGKFEHTKFEAFRCHVCFAENRFRMSQEHQLVAESGYNCFYCGHKCMECAECEKV
ncbi:hypothetical protein BLS_000188 [Venturia inaequalis]|uniref:Uncharacterized protein n=1 Tax=Venturia inaequalis TaxID=5025 RepID=A0A8H3V0D5_VENIN|nr:hypothetical protein BLS_000188 [Venturia inaequalis]KAE9989689.1 hypothetical protein EG327_002370 [Venturia inaequalis]RDI77782.1 hypothetical protein Vi05172_g12195 [Venturia inaequalis]